MEFHTIAGSRKISGFTLIEMLVVMAIIGLLLTIATLRYVQGYESAKGPVLRQNLKVMREAIGMYRYDKGEYPKALNELAGNRYLTHIPIDPFTGSAESWIIEESDDPDRSGIKNVHSGAEGSDGNGVVYAEY